MNEISLKDARRLFLHTQGLLRHAQFGRGKQATLRVIKQLGYIQIDTISVLDRAHHHVLKTRVPNYTESMLDHLQRRDREIFEYWAHAAAYLPMNDYRYCLPMMHGFSERRLPHPKLAGEVLARIRAEGPLQSRDFENPGGRQSSGWWDWKPAKQALESLFLRGELMITRRDGFQKVYDLTENVLPADIDTTLPSREEWCRFIVLRMLGALGTGTAMDLGYARTTIRRFTGTQIQQDLERVLEALVADEQVIRIDAGRMTFYSTPAQLAQLPLRLGKRQLRFLSPFDNLIINRRRTAALFDFNYQIECYVPEAKRKYGYYCLPILWGDELVGRLDAKAVRQTETLEVRLLHLEPHIKPDDALLSSLADGLMDLAHTNGCTRIQIVKTKPGILRDAITSLHARR